MSDLGLMCGVTAHSPDCLCDVVVTEPVAVNPDLRYGWFVKEVMAFGRHDTTTSEGLLSFLESWTEIHDDFVVRAGINEARGDGRRRYDAWRVYAKQRIDAGIAPRHIRSEIKERYGVDVNHQMFNQFKRRYLGKAA